MPIQVSNANLSPAPGTGGDSRSESGLTSGSTTMGAATIESWDQGGDNDLSGIGEGGSGLCGHSEEIVRK